MPKFIALLTAVGGCFLAWTYGTGEAGAEQAVRWTARISLVLFCAAMATEGWPSRLPHWADRLQLLRSLAVSHSAHAIAILALAALTNGQNLHVRSSPFAVFAGGLAYFFVFWGAAKPTSRLTSVGLFWIWGVFAVAYGIRAFRMPIPFALPMILLCGALVFRLLGMLATSKQPAAISPT